MSVNSPPPPIKPAGEKALSSNAEELEAALPAVLGRKRTTLLAVSLHRGFSWRASVTVKNVSP